jgi:hypothetical protein
MRLYTFGNYYLSSIQQGIQAAHVVAELFTKYTNELRDTHTPDGVLYEWAMHHKTMVCLNGGNNSGLAELSDRLFILGNALGLPFEEFREDVDSLGGVLTCCGIVVPAKIYEAAQAVRGLDAVSAEIVAEQAGLIQVAELELAKLLNIYGLAG